jgi:hypothetical protein
VNLKLSTKKPKAMLATKKKSLKIGKLVNTEHANTVIRNYKQERWAHNSTRLGKEDSMSVWYSVEELEQFFGMAKEHGADGIRMCFGVYDKDYADQPLYAGRQTIVLVATKEKYSDEGVVRKDVYINTENGPSILAYNAGGICPPICSSPDNGFGITIVDKGDEGMVVA